MATHDLHNGAALMALHRVAKLIDALDCRVACGIEADRIIGASDVVIDRSRHTDDRNAHAGELQRAAERTVAADGDNCVDAEELAHADSLLPSFRRQKFFTARGIEDRTAQGQDMADIRTLQLYEITRDQALIAAADPDALDSHALRGTHDGTDSSVHAGRVTAAGQDADSFHCICHIHPSFL